MKRAIMMAGLGLPPGLSAVLADQLPPGEYSVIPLESLPFGRPFPAWQKLAAGMDVELSASWLLLGEGAGKVRHEVKAGFLGCVSAVSGRDVKRIVRRLQAAASRSHVITDLETVRIRCARIRSSGKRLVFTNGVFDLFHVGHLRLLQAARARGDALVVGINSDESARRLKGRTRPAVSQFARAEVVAGVRGVNFCAIFGQQDPRELLRAVRPDILVKGSEYSLSGVVGRKLVEGWGGSVQRVPHVSGWSSTALMRTVGKKV
jgi:D-beta-D-heptose 7-phosphate kinase/D-beta-D-heptose 1-phosphate adenosyltransferase